MNYIYICFSRTIWKIRFSYVLLDMSYFYDLKNLRTLDVLNIILWAPGKSCLKLIKPELSKENGGEWVTPLY